MFKLFLKFDVFSSYLPQLDHGCKKIWRLKNILSNIVQQTFWFICLSPVENGLSIILCQLYQLLFWYEIEEINQSGAKSCGIIAAQWQEHFVLRCSQISLISLSAWYDIHNNRVTSKNYHFDGRLWSNIIQSTVSKNMCEKKNFYMFLIENVVFNMNKTSMPCRCIYSYMSIQFDQNIWSVHCYKLEDQKVK